ncbi:CPBP family intramembrane metalloprotease [Intestinibacillus massiliensis]|nr:CPBP family intramembrane metalloprotease [Intestinibacillus massiliensis]
MKNRTAFFSGLALFLCFCILSGSGRIIHALEPIHLLLGMLVAEVAAFVIPTLVIKLGAGRDDPVRLRTFPKVSTSAVLGFTVFSAVAVSIGVLLINYLFLQVNANHPATLSSFVFQSVSGVPAFLLLLVFIVIPPVFEELFLRGALFSAHEKMAGTGMCIAFSGLCFAMLHGSLSNFLGPLLAGCLYAYLTYAFDCVWLAVLAHLINNAFYLGVSWLSTTYSAFGIWKYIPGVSVVMLLFFGYLSFCCLESLLVHDKVPKFRRTENRGASLLSIVINPGFTVFLFAFIAKAILGLI